MSKIRLHGTSSGYVEIAPAAAASNNTLTAPSTVGEIIAKDAAGAIGVTSIKSSNINVGAAVTITESGIEASGIGITCANINGTQIGGRRNLIINGDMQVAQRGTSSTSNSYATVDRMSLGEGGLDETCTQAQVDVASGTTPYTSGFRKAYKITNGNQTSGTGATDYIRFEYRLEAQDIANSGWNYTDSNSKITLQFWVKSSVAQNFYFIINSIDGTARSFPMETGSLSANTWTKVTKTISGDSNLQFDNNGNEGLTIFFYLYLGTSYAGAGVSLNTWKNVGNPQTPANTTTWFTTNDATWEMTGLQLEVGPQATSFEHRSFGEELLLCQRYYFDVVQASGTNETFGFSGSVWQENNGSIIHIRYPIQMRSTPTFGSTNGTQYWRYFSGNDLSAAYLDGSGLVVNLTRKYGGELYAYLSSGTGSIGRTSWVRANNTAAKAYYSAEL